MRIKGLYFGTVFALVISVSASLAPAQATFTILGPFPIMTATYGVGTVPLTPPVSNSPAPWVFSSSNLKVATIAGKTIAVVGAGTSTITASQAATGVYTARSRTTQIRVSQGTPVVGLFAPQSISITQRTYTLVPPTSTSDGLWSYRSSNPLVATVAGNKLTFLAGGSTFIYADQSPTINWKAASTYMKFTVVAVAPVVGTFGDITIMKDSVGSLTLIPPTSNSPGGWTFTSSNPSVASVVALTVTPLTFGKTIITATQAPVGDFGAATAKMTLTVQGPTPTVGTFADVQTEVSARVIVIQSPSSTSSGTWSLISSDQTIAIIIGNVVTLLKPGIVTITASQAATSTFASPTPVSMTLTVLGDPSIGPWPDIQKVVKDPDFTLAPPTSTSPGTWTYSSANPSIADVVNGVVTVKGSGETTITATQAPTTIWQQASAKMMIRVFGAIPTIGTFAPIEATAGDAPLALKPPTSNSLGTWTFSSSNKNVAIVNGSTLTIVGAGTATITATQSPAGIYSQSNTVQTTITVKAKPSPIPTPKPAPTPSSTKPTPTPIPSPTLTAKSSPTPTPSTPAINATIKASASGRVVTVVAIGVKALVWINGKPAKVGKNSVKPGLAAVVITIDDKVVYRKNFAIK